MAGLRGRLHKSAHAASPRRSLRRGRSAQDSADVPGVFKDLISEAEASKTAGPDEDRKPLKKRKTTSSTKHSDDNPAEKLETSSRQNALSRKPESPSHPTLQSHSRSQSPMSNAHKPHDKNPVSRFLQTVEDSSESDDSDLEWEDALGQGNDDDGQDDFDDESHAEVGDVSITVGSDKGKEKESTKKVRRRGITSVDKKLRLDVHKMHVLCLLYHVRRRNSWCNDDKVQANLRKFAPPQTLSKLVPNPVHTQYQASKLFLEAMQDLKKLWTNRFTLAALGMHKPRWTDVDTEINPFADFDELDDLAERSDFRRVSRSLQGSQDVGAQLFCALLRSIGVEARLVCSLQCLPFASAAQTTTPQKPISDKTVVHLDPYNREQASSPVKAKSIPSRPKRLSRLERVFGERHPVLNSGVAPKQRKRYHVPYPVYWVEAFNSAQQRWVTVDPLATLTLDKPEKLEPPLNHSQNSLVYAIAFEDDGFAKDVTRRYAKAYNAKTRKFRVDFTEGGAKWWKRSLSYFGRSVILDRDQLEDVALAHREAAEGMPKNVQDFKNHPIYVLERHLRHNEVIQPMQSVGKVNVGTAMNPKMEPIYRRKNVHVVRSADKWYRLGRDVKEGEYPLKHAKPKKGAASANPLEMDFDPQEEELGAGLYAEFQTELYIPPPVVGGRVPRNAFGNLDLYVPSMVPGGGVHIRHKLASKAARLIGVDYVDAVTGFSFKGRHGTAIIQGVVVAQEFQEAVEATIESMEYSTELAEQTRRTSEALRLWRRFCLGLRIVKRINAIEIDGEVVPVVDFQEEIDVEDRTLQKKQLAGGFFVDEGVSTEPSSVRDQQGMIIDYDEMTGGFIADEDEHTGGGFIPEDLEETSRFRLVTMASDRPSYEADEKHSGGFVPEEDYLMSGGFIPDDDDDDGPSSTNKLPSSGITKATNHNAPTQKNAIIPEVPPSPLQKLDDTMDVDAQEVPSQITIPEVHLEPADIEHETSTIVDLKNVPPAQMDVSSPKSSLSEAGSLPLEDPDDEDAEPDWLLDAT